MKKAVTIFVIYFSILRVSSSPSSTEESKKIRFDPPHDPLAILILSFDRVLLNGAITNPIAYGQNIREDEFVDILFACPAEPIDATDANQNQTTAKEENEILVSQQILEIENNYKSFVEKYINQNRQLEEETSEKIAPQENVREPSSSGSAKRDEILYHGADLRRRKFSKSDPIENEDSVLVRDTAMERQKGSQGNSQKETMLPEIEMSEEGMDYVPEHVWNQALNEAKNYKCRRPVEPQFVDLGPSMFSHRIYLVGFEVYMEKYENLFFNVLVTPRTKKHKWLWSFTIVYDPSQLNVICVHHDVQYNMDTYSPQINDDFDNHDLGKQILFGDINIAQFYELENQKNIFDNLFENEARRKLYFNPEQKKFLVKVHLAPLHGFATPLIRESAKTYGNVAPMWDAIRTQAWLKVEQFINTLSHALTDFTVVSGTFETLKLDDKEVFLADRKLPVPLVFWKLVTYATDNIDSWGMFVVTSNNPFEDVGNILCEENFCEKYGWEYVQELDYTKGRTICCPFSEKILEDIPTLKGTQPKRPLDLKSTFFSHFVDEAWKFDESGKATTYWRRNEIFRKIRPDSVLPVKKIGKYLG